MAKRRMKLKDLPVPVQRALMAAFKEAGCMDLYQGDVVSYLDVIRERLRDTMKTNHKMEQQFDQIAELARLKTAARDPLKE